MMTLLGYCTLGCTSFGLGMLTGMPWDTWKETRRNVREEMQYAEV